MVDEVEVDNGEVDEVIVDEVEVAEPAQTAQPAQGDATVDEGNGAMDTEPATEEPLVDIEEVVEEVITEPATEE